MYSNGTNTSGGKQQGMMIKSSQQHLVNGNSAAIEYSSKNSSGGLSASGDGPLLSGVCDLCDGEKFIYIYGNMTYLIKYIQILLISD